jgi:hypothetical protein
MLVICQKMHEICLPKSSGKIFSPFCGETSQSKISVTFVAKNGQNNLAALSGAPKPVKGASKGRT